MTKFPQGVRWEPGGQVVPETHKITFKVDVVHGGDVHLGILLDVPIPAIPVGNVIVPAAMLADVIAAMQAAPPA